MLFLALVSLTLLKAVLTGEVLLSVEIGERPRLGQGDMVAMEQRRVAG